MGTFLHKEDYLGRVYLHLTAPLSLLNTLSLNAHEFYGYLVTGRFYSRVEFLPTSYLLVGTK